MRCTSTGSLRSQASLGRKRSSSPLLRASGANCVATEANNS